MMNKRDKQYEYSTNQVPPPGHLALSTVQHALIMLVSLAYPILLAHQLSAPPAVAESLIAFTMIAAGIGSILQSIGLPWIGCGYLCPSVCGASYFSLSLSAAWAGGLPLMRGVLIIIGLIEMIMAPVIGKMKAIFPDYVVGLVMTMVGVNVVKPAVASFFGLSFNGDAVLSFDICIGFLSLMTMVLSNLWGNGLIKMSCMLLGIGIGWISYLLLVPVHTTAFICVSELPLFALPEFNQILTEISFDAGMAVPVIIIAISGSLKSSGILLLAQKISEPELTESDFTVIRKGLLADGFSTALAGLLGGMAVDSSSSNIGLAGATKILSRWIGVAAGLLFIILAFFPRFVIMLSTMPRPVLGAALIFSGSFMICAGLQKMFGGSWDQRKTFTAGISIFFGLSTSFLPGLFARAPHFIQTFFTNPLPTTAIAAIVLNLLFNLDILLKNSTDKNKTQ